MNFPQDTNINWRINSYDADTTAKLKASRPLCVLHDVPVNIGGVIAKIHIFVVEHAVADLLLGRPWERVVRAEFKNEDDGSYTVKIRSPDGTRMVKFCAVKADHERNREFVRDPGDFRAPEDEPLIERHLKV